MDNSRAEFTWYEKRVIRYELNKIRNVIRRACTLDDVMCIVINEPTHDEKQKEDWVKTNLMRSTGTISGTLSQHAAAQQVQIAHINAHQQLMNQAQYASGYADARSYWTGGSKCTL
jgi:hypothetical protein